MEAPKQFPSQIAQYRVERELGRGAMGVVFEAVDTIIGRRVALKLILQDGEPNDPAYQEACSRFLQEGRSAGVLSHPHIVTIYQVGEHDSRIFLAMEFVEGDSLDRLLQPRRSLPADKVLHVLRAIALALDHAHTHSVIHRDVKPANILLAKDGTVKLTDFGIAKSMEQTGLTRTGYVLGTPFYMAPEQIQGLALTGHADQFSLGVVAYELLAGTRPFNGADPTAVCYQIVHEHPHPLHTVQSGLPAQIDVFIARALAKKPQDRYASCAAFVRDLEGLLRPQVDPRETVRKLVPRHESRPDQAAQAHLWKLASVGAMSVAVIAGGLGYRAHRSSTTATHGMPAVIGRAGTSDTPADRRRAGPPLPPVNGPTVEPPEPSIAAKSSTQPAPSRSVEPPPPEAISARSLTEPSAPAVRPSLAVAPVLKPQWGMVNGSPTQSGGTSGVGPVSPRVQWSFRATGAIRGSVVISGDGTVYFGDQSGSLRGVRSGQEVWTSHQKAAILGAPVLLDNGVVVATMEPSIVFIQRDGGSGWTLPISVAVTASPVEQGGVIFVGSTDSHAYAIKGGQVLWRQRLSQPVRRTASADRNLVYVSAGSILHALSVEDGSQRWSHNFEEDISTPSTDGQGAIYVTTSAGKLYAMNRSGRLQWSYEAAAPILTSASLHPNGAIVFGCADRSVYAVRGGELLWKFAAGSPVRTSALIDRNGVAYFGSASGNFYAVGPEGQPEWSLALGGELAAPPSVGADGSLLAVTHARTVLALR